MHDAPAATASPAEWPARLAWLAVLSGATVLFSLALACATPFAALATLAALTLGRREAVGLVGLAWVANQAVGFGLHGYPHTAATYGWGVAIGLAALAGLAAAGQARRLPAGGPVAQALAHALLGLVAAFAAYEAVLYAAAFLLPGGEGAFAPSIVARLFGIDAAALAGLALLHAAGAGLGLAGRTLAPAA